MGLCERNTRDLAHKGSIVSPEMTSELTDLPLELGRYGPLHNSLSMSPGVLQLDYLLDVRCLLTGQSRALCNAP